MSVSLPAACFYMVFRLFVMAKSFDLLLRVFSRVSLQCHCIFLSPLIPDKNSLKSCLGTTRRQHAAVLTLKHEPCWIAVATVDIREFKIRRLRTTNYGWTSVFVCLEHWVESCKYRTLRFHYRRQTTREEAERETTRKNFLVFTTVHKNASQFCM